MAPKPTRSEGCAQEIVATVEGAIYRFRLPSPETELMPGVTWGASDAVFTPAYWAVQARLAQPGERISGPALRQGRFLREEVAACILGGHRIKSEMAAAAFHRLQEMGLLEGTPCSDRFERVLRTPFLIGGRTSSYPLPRTKAEFLAKALAKLPVIALPLTSDRAFRDALCELPGVGLKTASWITRNWLLSDKVAVLDIHVLRAGLIAGVFGREERLPRDYRRMEERFVTFAEALGVRLPVLDMVIWEQMRKLGAIASRLLGQVRSPLNPAESAA